MFGQRRNHRDPFWDDGTGARERHHRHRIESLVAFAAAVAACGLAAAVWLRDLAPLVTHLPFH